MLRTYKTCNSTVRFSKYEFYNKLLDGERERERERERGLWVCGSHVVVFFPLR